MTLSDYTPQQSRFDSAFSGMATCCSILCDACGRVYFVTGTGAGDYEEDELESLLQRAEESPDKVIEVPDYSSVAFAIVDDKQIVIGCICDPTKRWSEWIESHADELTAYLGLYWKAKKEEASHLTKTADEAIVIVGADDRELGNGLDYSEA